ncbi:hypothetical protein H632_c160p2 [Helicosporidium sp. ATCC 50920]|nr:hypothetical protein H632_c160p2 [Helicosporidium sp. ATCC 50920]|eukprot:KDD76615.1 hypothetical protein H632_c160p2 [Helicosporidium sp. ATCC 50920]
MDGQPFESLHHILRDLNDERIWVFAEWVGPEYAARVGTDWSPNYHGMLYNLTDDAIQMCDRRTEWLLVTNGDNEYADSFFATAASQGADADIVAFDFYSRFQRITAPSCERFAAAAAPPLAGPRPGPGGLCKANRLRWCHTDLGANVLRRSRFYDEGRSFGLQRSGGLGLGPAHADGLLAQELVQAGWRVKRVADGCHFSHAPNPQACAWGGGIWDDREVGAAAGSSQGGDCLTPEQARWVMDNDPNAEQVEISLTQDGAVHAYEGVRPVADFRVSCLRRKDFASAHVWGAAIDWYSEYCADDVDVAVARNWRAQSARARAEYEEQQRLAAQEKTATKEEL